MALTQATIDELERLRADAPIVDAGPGVHLVVGAAAADRILRDDASFEAVQHLGRLDDPPEDRTLLESRPAFHAPRRRILAVPFTGERLASCTPIVETVVGGLIDRFAADGRADLVTQLARPANGQVLARLLGIAEADREHVFGLATAVLEAENSSPPVIGAHASAAPRAAFAAWALDHVAARRADPAPPEDALTAFLHPDAATGIALTDHELVAHLRTFCESAIGFTGRAIANLLHLALTDETARGALRDGGARAAATIDDSLRLDPPVTYALRTCTETTTVGDTVMRPGDRVLVSIVAVNRDPAATRHVSLGRGPHACLGAALYRLLATHAVGELLRRLPDVVLADEFVYEDHPYFTGHAPQHLDVVFTPRPSASSRAGTDCGA